MVIIVETEIWPYFAYSCKKRQIPLYIINARISDTSYNSYKKMKFFFKKSSPVRSTLDDALKSYSLHIKEIDKSFSQI